MSTRPWSRSARARPRRRRRIDSSKTEPGFHGGSGVAAPLPCFFPSSPESLHHEDWTDRRGAVLPPSQWPARGDTHLRIKLMPPHLFVVDSAPTSVHHSAASFIGCRKL